MATLYVTTQGARLEKHYQSLLVTKDDESIMRVPIQRLSEVVLVGSVGMTTPAMVALLDRGIGVSLLTRAGKMRGRLSPATQKNVFLRRSQYQRAVDPQFVLEFSRNIVAGKLKNQRTLARRICRTRPYIDQQSLDQFRRLLKNVACAQDIAALRGYEGVAASIYFSILKQGLLTEWQFHKRQRRPPGDPANALLSLGYSLLTHNLITALEIAGLDPFEGFFHADKYGRPALALDLVEEFRSLIVDSILLNVVNRGILKPDDFEPGRRGGIYLNSRGLRNYFHHYQARLETKVFHPQAGRSLSYQKCFEIQARQLRKVIEGECPEYRPFITK